MSRLPSNLPDLLREAGLTVIEIDGWETRGRDPEHGPFAPVGVLNHHTGDKANGLAYAKWLFLVGRSDLPAPLCHLSIDRQGRVYVGAAGRANHAGKARAAGSVASGDGNTLYVGIEAQNTGTEGWSAEQYGALVTANAVINLHVTHNSAWTNHAHYETSVTGKWDPGDPAGRLLGKNRVMNMDKFRADVVAKMSQLATPPRVLRPKRSPKHVPGAWAKFAHLKPYYVNDSIDGLDWAVKHGYNAIDLNFHVTRDKIIVNTHWSQPLLHGFHDPLGKIATNAQIKDLTWREVSRLRSVDGHRIRTAGRMLREAKKRGLRVEFEAKNSPAFTNSDIWRRVKDLADKLHLSLQMKVESWVDVPGGAPAILAAAKAGGIGARIVLPRKPVLKKSDYWGVANYVRGPVVWR